MDYHVIIEPSGSEKIEFATSANDGASNDSAVQGDIQSFRFKMNSLNDDALERDQHARCEMRLEGEINDHTREKTGKLADWAMRVKNLYATVTVEVIAFNDSTTGTTLRSYVFDKMFCVDYEEIYADNGTEKGSDTGQFKLFMAQGPHYTKRIIVSV
ncbi:MAG: hypothetical protein IJQ81_18610 [Oscillibacter sp.]|nr:hypothetical protein [Oscillibacter sp.]